MRVPAAAPVRLSPVRPSVWAGIVPADALGGFRPAFRDGTRPDSGRCSSSQTASVPPPGADPSALAGNEEGTQGEGVDG